MITVLKFSVSGSDSLVKLRQHSQFTLIDDMTKAPNIQFLLQNGYAKEISSCSKRNTLQIEGSQKTDKGSHA